MLWTVSGELIIMVMIGGIGTLVGPVIGGAFFVLLLRLTQKRFSATQYALFSSLFGIPRIVAGPICGFLVDALGWKTFFWLTIASGLPGMVLLARFVPWGVRDPAIEVEAPPPRPPLTRGGYVWRAVAGGVGGAAAAGPAGSGGTTRDPSGHPTSGRDDANPWPRR